jgi:transcriptional regulator with XRE-family HTH domain
MDLQKLVATIVKEDVGYSACTTFMHHSVHAEGESFQELVHDLLEAINFALEEQQTTFTSENLIFRYDLKSFFAFYRVLNAKALSKRIGMNQSLLAQYISGKKRPSDKQTRRILQGVKEIGQELTEIDFIIP